MQESEEKQMIGAPLAICINDCELDRGQHPHELAVLCFRVRCAFAEMRWGDAAKQDHKLKSILDEHVSGSLLLTRSA